MTSTLRFLVRPASVRLLARGARYPHLRPQPAGPEWRRLQISLSRPLCRPPPRQGDIGRQSARGIGVTDQHD